MPRRLIIGILVVLILGIVGGTIALVVQRFRGDEVATLPTPSPGGLTPAQPGSQQVTNPTGDDDNDGLTNAEEVLWGTSSANPDTDNDGYKDGEEVAANHNPTIPAPGDKLPENFQPGQNIQPLAPAAPLAADQFFEDNLDLTRQNVNLTEGYRDKYPEQERTPDTLVAYAKSQPIITKLPRPAVKSIQIAASDTPLALDSYLDIAGNLAVFSNRSVLAEGLDDVFSGGNPGIIYGQAASMRLHQKGLIARSVPPAAVELHKLLLGYTELLAATYEQIAQYNDDPVKALNGVYQLETIDQQYYPLIEQEVGRLKQLADQLQPVS